MGKKTKGETVSVWCGVRIPVLIWASFSNPPRPLRDLSWIGHLTTKKQFDPHCCPHGSPFSDCWFKVAMVMGNYVYAQVLVGFVPGVLLSFIFGAVKRTHYNTNDVYLWSVLVQLPIFAVICIWGQVMICVVLFLFFSQWVGSSVLHFAEISTVLKSTALQCCADISRGWILMADGLFEPIISFKFVILYDNDWRCWQFMILSGWSVNIMPSILFFISIHI